MKSKRKPEPIPNSTEATVLQCLLHGERYGLQIRDEYQQRASRAMAFGSLYTTLDRMIDKGFLTSRDGESASERGGNRRRYFKITADGIAALNRLRKQIGAESTGGLSHA